MAQRNITLYFSGPSTSTSASVSHENSTETRAAPLEGVRTGVNPSASKHRKTGVDPSWRNDFPWLETSVCESGEPGMWCNLCKEINCRPKRAPLGKAVWIEVPCKTITRQRLVEHLESDCHKEAMRITSSRRLAERRGGITEAFDEVVTEQKKAFIGHLKCMHFLAKQEIAHTTNFLPLVKLGKSLGASYLGSMSMGQNMKYTSERFMQEIVLAMGESVQESLKEEIQASPVFALLVDETTDVSILKQLIINGRYLLDREVRSRFLGIVELPDGKAVTITDAIFQFCGKMDLDIHRRLFALGSDSASVMLGCRGGVSTLLKEKVPYLIVNHCVAHRLALACGQAANEINYLKKFKTILAQLYRYYQYSPVRMAGLKRLQEVLNDPQMKLTQANDVRWLSHEKAVHNLRLCLPSVLASLEREATERSDAQAHGLALFVKNSFFVASLYFLADIQPPLANLSRAFQRKSINFSMVKPLVQGTKQCIEALTVNEGAIFSTLSSDMEGLVSHGFLELTTEKLSQFKREVYDPYLTAISEHLDSRFPDVALLNAFSIFDPSTMDADIPPDVLQKLNVLKDQYGTHDVVEPTAFDFEYQCFSRSVLSTPNLQRLSTHDLMTKLISNPQLKNMFPNLAKVAAIGLVVPMSTADCERVFSTLSRIKTDLRNRLSCKVLNSLMTISIEGPDSDEFPYERTCSIWSSWSNRRLVL